MNCLSRSLLVVVCCLLPQLCRAAPIPRTILAVVDGEELKDETFNLIAAYAETPLNHLGFRVEYVDVAKALPDDAEMQQFAGIMSWFLDNKLRNASAYAGWITRQLTRGKKLLVVDNPGFAIDASGSMTPQSVMDAFYKAFLISWDPGESADSPLLIEIAANDPAMTEFERGLAGELDQFEKIAVLDRSAKVYLKLRRKDTGDTGDAVFVHSRGGFVLGDYAIYKNPENYKTQWRINPFEFFAKVFDADFPKPDITTINGMRLFMSHIDGDGIRNISNIDHKTPSGQLAYDLILTKVKLPISSSVVIGDLVMASDDERGALFETMRRIFALPNVEPASHGWAHPLIWAKEKRKIAYDIPGYVYSPENEIGASLAYINAHLVPRGKETSLFFWTGNCRPDAAALQYTHDHGIGNINGGDTRFDQERPSYTSVAPLNRHLDDLLQHYAVDSNEVPYTNIWTGPFHGYRYVKETFVRTESPIRIRPIDIYYHFYNMEHAVSFQALKEIYAWALAQEIAPVFVSEYLAKLEGFLQAAIERRSQGSFVITGNKALRTFRMDHTDAGVDLARSKGVIGFRTYQGSLYLFLDNGERSEVVLTAAAPSRPYLHKANGEVADWTTSGGNVAFRLRVIGRLQFEVAGLKPLQEYTASLGDTDETLRSDAQGMLRFSKDLPGSAFEWVDILIKGHP